MAFSFDINIDMKRKSLSENLPLNRLETYIEKEVLPKMHLAGTPFSLEPTDLGNRNIVLFLSVDNSKVNIFKGFRKKRRIKNSLLANRFLARCNINVPKTLFSDLSQKTFRRFGYFFSCEEKIDGKSLAEISNVTEVIHHVARFYAQMHSIRSSRWGKLASGRKYGFGNYIMDKVTKRVDMLKGAGNQLSAKNTKTYMRWFEKKLDSIKAIKGFSLCHSDVNKKNILFSDSNQVYIIDNEAVKYLPFPIEFYRLKFLLCADSSEAQGIFEESYFESCPPARRKEFNRCCYFYRAYVLLELACYFTRKLNEHNTAEDLRNYYESNCKKALSALEDSMHEK